LKFGCQKRNTLRQHFAVSVPWSCFSHEKLHDKPNRAAFCFIQLDAPIPRDTVRSAAKKDIFQHTTPF
jgi:hypothetical protein